MGRKVYLLVLWQTNLDRKIPSINPNSKSGPKAHDLHGIRWTLAQFEDGTRLIVRDVFVSGKHGREDHVAKAFDKLRTVPWIGLMIFVKNTASYINDIVGEADLIEWTVSNDATDADMDSAAVCAAAALSLDDYKGESSRSRVSEAEDVYGASAMQDNVNHPLLADPMFEAICAAIEESEKSWASVAEFEDAVSQRFKLINDKGGRTKKKLTQQKL